MKPNKLLTNMKPKVAYLGPEKTFTEKAAKQAFPDADLVPMQPIRNVVLAIENERADYGVVPLENFYNGEVRDTLDSLTECSRARIIQEQPLSIIHCLGALKEHGTITIIRSKDQALEQCSRYLCEHYPSATLIATASTAEAAKYIAEQKALDSAAIANEQALLDSKLEVLAKDICPNNKTRFVILARQDTEQTGDDKTFLAIHPSIKDRPGVLYNTLGFLAGLGINLEAIQSRPDGRKGYYFYLELDGHEKDRNVALALDAIRLSLDPSSKHPKSIKILGSYPNTHWKDEN